MQFVSKPNLGVCESCHQRPATGEFTYVAHLRGARRWLLCDSCVQQFAPGIPNLQELRKKAEGAGDAVCGWTSYQPRERPQNEEPSP